MQSDSLLPVQISEPRPIRSFPQLADQLTDRAKKGWIGRHVAWLKESDEQHGKTILKAIEIFALCLTVIGIYFVIKGYAISAKLDDYQKLRAISSEEFKPPTIDTVISRGEMTSYNHVKEYCLHNNLLWSKERNNPKAEWQLMYYDGYLTEHSKPVSISADGANLAILDESRNFHYKKVLKETRLWFWNDEYKAKDITEKDNWYDRWFSLPVVQRIYHLFYEKRLSLPEGWVWSMSHRGKYVRHYEDQEGRKHPEFAMVTTLFAAKVGENWIHYGDPYLWNRLENKLAGPNPNFAIKKISCSASTLYVWGEEYLPEEGRSVEKGYTLNFDFDQGGRNPFLPSYWFPNLRAIGQWREQPQVSLGSGDTFLTDIITVAQDGEGDSARELRIEGKKVNGVKVERGYYLKRIDAPESNFWRWNPIIS